MSSFQMWCLLQVSKYLKLGHVFCGAASPLLFKTLWCSISSSISKRNFGIKVLSFWSFDVGIWSHSFLIKVSSCWRVRGYLWSIFHLMMHQMFSIGERSGLPADQFSSLTLLWRSHAVVIAAVCGFALSCWNTQGLPWNRRCLEGSRCWSKTFLYTFQHS